MQWLVASGRKNAADHDDKRCGKIAAIMGGDRLPQLLHAVDECLKEIRTSVNELQIFPRRFPELDRVLFGLLNRSLNTVESLLLLGRESRGADAMALSRVAIEIWIIVRWITNKDQFARAQKFAFFESKLVERTVAMIRTHDPNTTIPGRLERIELANVADKYSSHIHWAGTVRAMAEEAEEVDNTISDTLYFYNVPYFMSSWYAHANVAGVGEVVPDWGVPFSLKTASQPHLCEMSLVVAMNCAALTTMRICDTLKLNASGRVQDSWNKWISPLLL